MENLDNIKNVVSYQTKKVSDGFQAICYSFGYQTPTIEHFNQTYKTRAIATNRAKKASRYVKSIQNSKKASQ